MFKEKTFSSRKSENCQTWVRSDSSYNTLTNNTASSNNRDGIILRYDSSYNTLTNNTASSNTQNGIYLYFASNNILASNTASSNNNGIYVYRSSNNTLSNNIMSSNNYNFGISTGTLNDYLNDINESNLVDDKPIYYWTNRSDAQIPSDAGAVYVINSTNITVRDIEIANSSSGVLLAYTDRSTIQNITVSDNYFGVSLDQSSSNTLDNINASSNGYYGIFLSASNNTLTNNTANSNEGRGISLYGSSSTLTNNTANSNEQYGIYLSSSSNSVLSNNTANNNAGSFSPTSVSLDAAVSPTAGSSDSYGIYITSSNNITSTGDHAIGNGDYDFYASNSDGITVDSLVLTDNSAQISFVTDTSTTGVSGSETSSYDLDGKTNVNGYVSIAHNGDMNFTFMYDDSGMSSSSESSVALFRLNNSEWSEVPNTLLNTAANSVSANISYFGPAPLDMSIEYYTSTFGLFTGSESSSSTSSSSSSTSSSSGSVATRVRSQGTTTDMPTNEDGEVTGDTVAKSSDTKTTLTLYKGTTATDPSGNPVNKIIVTVPASLPADTPEEVIESGLYYDFGPSGTSFNKEVLVTIDFDPEEFEGKAPTIYTYTAEGGWEALETTVDWDSGKATATTRHFSVYALLGDDVEVAEDTAVETPVIESSPVTGVETATEDDSNSGYLYWFTGIGIVLVLGIIVIRNKKGDGGL